MITHIQGKLIDKTPTYVVIDVNGVYFINITKGDEDFMQKITIAK